MSFPSDVAGLERSGYTFEGDGKCKKCDATIAWYTTPKGKKIPMDFGTATPHWVTCTESDRQQSATAPTSKITTATLDMDWLKKQAATCFCTVCKKITGRS